MLKNKWATKTNFYLTLIIVGAIIIALNLILSLLPLKIDLTENKIFSLSPVTKRILKNLDDIITIKCYFSENLPGYLVNVREEVKDVLKEYQNLSGGKIKIQFLDPAKSDEIKQEALRANIPPVQINVVKEDKYEVAQVFLGMAIFFQDKKENIPVVQNINSLEYDLTSRIKKITLDKTPKIAFVKGYDTLKIDEDLQNLKKQLNKEYDLETLDLKKESDFEEIQSIVLAGPKKKIEAQELNLLKNLIQQGKNLIVLADGVQVDNSLIPQKIDSGLTPLLADFGIKLNQDLIVDPINSKASFSNGFFQFFVPYLYWPRITEQGFNQENGMVNKLQSITLPWVSSIEIEKKEGYKVDLLAETSPKSEIVEENFDLNPKKKPAVKAKSQDKHIAALHLYRDNPKEKGKLNLILVSDSDFIRDNFVSRFPENLTFFQNLVDGVSLDQDLITIRSKAVSARPLKEISKEGRAIIKYFNIFAMSLIFCGIGLGRYLVRRKVKPAYL